jgi:hypothetical protein
MEKYIENILKNIFINLNSDDIRKLTKSSIELIDEISLQLFNNKFYESKENTFTCLKSIILLLLPYISQFNFSDLNQILYLESSRNIIYKKEMKHLFPYSTIAIELLNESFENILDLYDENNVKLIYKIIDTNLYYLKKTIHQINCKMYCNWTTIVPIIDYKNSSIYINTKQKLNNYLNNINSYSGYNGLSIDTFYDTFINIYYNDIKPIKFLIFFYKLNDQNIYVIQYLHKWLDLNKVLNSESWNNLNNQEQNNFKNKCDNIKLQNNNEFVIWSEIFKFIELNKRKYKFDQEFNYELDKNNIPENYSLLKHIKKCDSFWLFLKLILEKFKSTIYSKYLIKDNKITDFIYYEDNLHLKNIYNICKSFKFIKKDERIEKDKRTEISNYYNYLSLEEQEEFCKRFNNNIKFIDWVNIINNYRREQFRSDISKIEYDEYISKIETSWNNVKNDLVWEYLSHSGILSEFKLDKINVMDYSNNNYFITNSPYQEEFLNNLKNRKWYTLDSFHWIFQINFYMHYIYTDVHYVTGSTGTGKSTQTPKLYLYALKMLDYKMNGQILCSEPRIEPTTNNAKRISDELGFPIYKKDNPSLRFGSLAKNSNSSNLHSAENKTENYVIQYEYAIDRHISDYKILNLKLVTDGLLLIRILDRQDFDIIIIDEAHEHNANMDLLLTFCKFLYKYKRFKLVIISATMDNDEATYRRYFKNMKQDIYPNLIYLDKRMNISIFANETLYAIKEYYRSNKTPMDIIREILNNSTSGEILFFQNGRKEIMEMVTLINASTPSNVIALPYLGELDQEYKNIIINIHTEKFKLKIKKEEVDKWINKELSQDISYSYSRCIIVATNIAEASITLESLKFVIDNGTYNEITYNYNTNSAQFRVNDISEQSRIQRKGRVGRVSGGTIYYLYEKDSKKNIKNRYNITKEDFTTKLIQFLEKDVKFLNNIEIKEDEVVKETNNTIFSLSELLDISGTFYLVHPFEHLLKRDIFLNVEKELDMNYFVPMLKNIGNHYLYVNMNPKFYFENINLKNYLDKFEKTELFDLVKKILPKFSPDISELNEIITLIYAIHFRVFKEVLFVITILKNPTIFYLFKIFDNHIIKSFAIFQDLQRNHILDNNETEIINWCSKRIDSKYNYLIINLIKKYNKLLLKLSKDIDILKDQIYIKSDCLNSQVLKCFTFGYFKNIAFKIDDNYITVDGLVSRTKQQTYYKNPEHSIVLYLKRNDEISEISILNELDYKLLLENPMVFNSKSLLELSPKNYYQIPTLQQTNSKTLDQPNTKTLDKTNTKTIGPTIYPLILPDCYEKYGDSWDLIRMQIINNFKYDYVFKTTVLNNFLNNVYKYLS